MPLTLQQGRLADELYAVEAIRFGEFRLKLHETHPDAPLSPIYLNLRTRHHPKNPGPLTDKIMDMIGEQFQHILERGEVAQFDRFVDIPDAGAPFGNQVARIIGRPEWRLRLTKHFRPDGTRYIGERADGWYAPGAHCLLIDEMITGADSKFEAIHALEKAGMVVTDVLVAIDRAQGGKERLAAAGYTLHAAFTLPDLLAYYVDQGYLRRHKAQEILDYLEQNQVA